MPADTRSAILLELYKALEQIDAPRELLAIVGSWGDTLDDATTLQHIKSYNRKGTIFETIICDSRD